MTRRPAEPLLLDCLIRAGAIHSMTGETHRSVGLRGPEIVAVSSDLDGLDDLAASGTAVVDAGDLTVLPAFADSHEHLMEASRNTLLVPVDTATSIAEFTGMITAAARDAVPGEWILTSIGWHESNLAENRVPTLAELDAASPDHPVLARRGGHFAVVNSAALQAAGIDADTPDPPGGKIGRRPTAAAVVCWKAVRCTRSRGSRPGRTGRRWPVHWGRPRPLMPRWGWAPSARR